MKGGGDERFGSKARQIDSQLTAEKGALHTHGSISGFDGVSSRLNLDLAHTGVGAEPETKDKSKTRNVLGKKPYRALIQQQDISASQSRLYGPR